MGGDHYYVAKEGGRCSMHSVCMQNVVSAAHPEKKEGRTSILYCN